MSAIRVAHIITGLGVGGAERAVLDLSNGLIERGAVVAVFCVGARMDILEQSHDGRIQVIGLGISWKPIHLLRGICRLVQAFWQFKPTVVHAHMFHGLVVALLCKAVAWRTRIVFTSHSSRVSPLRAFMIWATRRLRACDVVFSRDQHVELNSSEVAVIPNGTKFAPSDVARRGKRPCAPWVLICVGRLSAPKAPIQLVEQIARLGSFDAELWLVGDGELRADVSAAVRRLNLSGRVRLLGMRSDVLDLLDQAHLFVMGSEWEGMPISLLEAGTRGLPVLATPVGSIPELLSDECGYLASRSEFPVMIRRILEDYDDALLRAARLQRRVTTRYSIKAMCDAHLRLYQSLCSPSVSTSEEG